MTALNPRSPEDESITENAPSDLHIEVEAELTTGLAGGVPFAASDLSVALV